MTDCLHYF